eukprot:scaffold16440_cov97-Isochrysis_galbana.AAC.1
MPFPAAGVWAQTFSPAVLSPATPTLPPSVSSPAAGVEAMLDIETITGVAGARFKPTIGRGRALC